ncbi:hypothetical protein vseg_017038 [Gypsophila vaccaria]
MDSLVIKVKYEDMLRRFNVAINGDQRLDANMETLRLKICALFNLPSDTELCLTYKDEDDDAVTLVDDDDLHDVVRQGLDPVRITVHLKSEQSCQSSSAPYTENSAPSTPFTQNVQPNISTDAAVVLDAVQQPLSPVLLNLKSFNPDSQQNADSSAVMTSVHERLAHSLFKLSLGILSKSATTASHQNEDGDKTDKFNPNSESKKHEGSQKEKYDKITRDAGVGVSAKSPVCPSVSFNKGENSSSESSSNKMSRSGGTDKSNDVSAQMRDMTTEDFLTTAGVVASEKDCARDAAAKVKGVDYEMIPSIECPFSGIPLTRDNSLEQSHSSNRSSSMAKNLCSIVHKGIGCDGCGALPINGPRFKSKVKYDYDLCSKCFSKMGNDRDYTRIDFPSTYNHPRSFKVPLVAGNFCRPILHKDIICDGCDVQPIIGPRFKSKVKNDYDLCGVCFSRMGNDSDYIKIDLSSPYGICRAPGLDPRSHIMRPHLLEPRSRFDSCFIMDVTVVDGTAMPPSMPFTKIWRMRNIGTLPWNYGLQLLWIGGDRFRPSDSIKIQVPSNGVAVGFELDIAVDFIAPELPGQYISCWRMADQSGQKFGQRVWVQIQVDPSVDLTHESSSELNLNLPPKSNETAFPELVDVKVEPALDIEVGRSSAQPSLDQNHKTQIVGLNFPINDDLLDAGTSTYLTADKPASPVEPASGSYPKVDAYSSIDKFGESSVASTNVQDKSINLEENNLDQECEKPEIEEEFLKELAQISFKQIDSSKALPTDELDLDDSEWDPILEELKEMGFEDKGTNKKLLAKNNGSISRVVMDLIAEEKA